MNCAVASPIPGATPTHSPVTELCRVVRQWRNTSRALCRVCPMWRTSTGPLPGPSAASRIKGSTIIQYEGVMAMSTCRMGPGRKESMLMREIRELLALGCRVLGAAGHGDLVWGHLSMRDPAGRGVWMKASGWGFEEVMPDRVLLVDRDGGVLEGAGRRHVEYPIHTEIMAVRADVNAVAHTHSAAAVAFGATGRALQPVSHEATLFVPPDIARFTKTGDLILTPELGGSLAEVLGDRNAALMVNHGVVVAAPDVPTAVVTTVLLDAACEMNLRVLAAGGAARVSPEAEALAKREHCYPAPLLRQAWDYLVRRLPA